MLLEDEDDVVEITKACMEIDLSFKPLDKRNPGY